MKIEARNSLASILQLRLTVLLLDEHNGSHHVAYEDIDVGKVSSSIVDNPYFFISYSDKLAGRESFFELQCTITSIIGIQNSSAAADQSIFVTDAPIICSIDFTTQSGAKAAEVPNSASSGSGFCFPHGGWSMEWDVSDFTTGSHGTYAFMAPGSPSIGPVPCVKEVEGATAANITAGLAAATATTTTTPARSSSTGAAATTAVTSSGSGVVAAVWTLLMLGLSAVLFIC